MPRWLGPLAAGALLLALTAVLAGAYWDGYQLRREAMRLAREREQLQRRNAQLREEIRLLGEPGYIERIAREQLGLLRPDEIAVILVQPTPAPPPSPADRTDQDAATWWRRLIGRPRD
ncbi:MAG: septum formation initiator family protein [Armatimonadota bacterium]|nr:septum formation initiator family protein [Armatimonadota bacterium]MDR7518173.1 septum formation initiator family protein [Armatimonadota bacterium]MDR7548928.1 septum formation initiator family protein [Armatimonadota bacterium]